MINKFFTKLFYWLPITFFTYWAMDKKIVSMTINDPVAAQWFIRFLLGFIVWLIITDFSNSGSNGVSK